jgi:hypothetical protein
MEREGENINGINPAYECAAYFKNNKAYTRLINALRKKYRSLGRVGGQIRLIDATEAECRAARDLFGVSFSAPLIIALADFEKAIQQTRYKGVTLHSLLEAYFDSPILSNKEIREQKRQIINGVIAHVRGMTVSDTGIAWLDSLENNAKYGFRLISGNREQLPLEWACKSFDWLESSGGAYQRLAMLSAVVTSDPHTLDSNTITGKLFLHLLAFREGCDFPPNAEARDSLYYKAGILCDSISSTVSQIGLRLYAN